VNIRKGGFFIQLRKIHQGRGEDHPDYYRIINLEYLSRCDSCFFTYKRPHLYWRRTFVQITLKYGHKIPRLFFQCKICKHLNEQIEVRLTPEIILILIDSNMNEKIMSEKLKEVYGENVFLC